MLFALEIAGGTRSWQAVGATYSRTTQAENQLVHRLPLSCNGCPKMADDYFSGTDCVTYVIPSQDTALDELLTGLCKHICILSIQKLRDSIKKGIK